MHTVLQIMGKHSRISQSEYRGIKMPESRGGSFVGGTHEVTYGLIRGALEEAEVFPNHLFSTFDLLAYVEWYRNYEYKSSAKFVFENEHGDDVTRERRNALYAFDDFAVSVLNIAKIGTFDSHKRDIVYTADKEPHITFEPWLREGFRIVQPLHYPYGFTFDPETKLFKPTKPTSTQFLMNREAQARLSEETGREL